MATMVMPSEQKQQQVVLAGVVQSTPRTDKGEEISSATMRIPPKTESTPVQGDDGGGG